MRILKFGGSSVGSPDRIRNVVNLIAESRERDHSLAVVVSAIQGITNELLEAGALASRCDPAWRETYTSIVEKHTGCVEALLSGARRAEATGYAAKTAEDLAVALHECFSAGRISSAQSDYIMSFGERLSAYTVSQALRERGMRGEYLDAREVVKTDYNFGRARVHLEESYREIMARIAGYGHEALPVITGFIGATALGQTTTLGRGGSDYTAAIFGAALQASEIEIWTDVDGVMTADPKKVDDAFSIQAMTYQEAMEMAHFGAKVIYPPTIRPALQKRIPVRILNTFNPGFPGTVVRGDLPPKDRFLATGLSSLEEIALLRVEGSGMIGVAGIAARLFGALARHRINVVFVTQASSEHSICLALESKSAAEARLALEEEFRAELGWGEIDDVLIEEGLAIVAVVGENMRNTPGVAGKVFGALGEQGVNVIAIAQGSSELNISIVVSNSDEKPALTALHRALFRHPEPAFQSPQVGGGSRVGPRPAAYQNGVPRSTPEASHEKPFSFQGEL